MGILPGCQGNYLWLLTAAKTMPISSPNTSTHPGSGTVTCQCQECGWREPRLLFRAWRAQGPDFDIRFLAGLYCVLLLVA